MKKKFWIIYTVIGLISVAYIVLFIIKMWRNSLSSNIEEWSYFGSFISPLVSLVTMIILIITIQDNEKQTVKIIQNSNDNEEKNRQENRLIEDMNRNNDNIKELSENTILMFKKVAYFFEDFKIYKEMESKLVNINKDKKLTAVVKRAKINEYQSQMYQFELKFIDNEDIIISNLLKIETLIHLYFKNEIGARILCCANYLKDSFRNRETVYNKTETFFSITTDFNYLCLKHLKDLKNKFPISEIKSNEINKIMASEYNQFDDLYKLNIIDLNKKEEEHSD